MSTPPAQEEFHAEGQTFEDDHLIIYGNYNTVLGDHCTIIGDRNRVTGKYATVVGDDNIVAGEGASVQGDGNTITENCVSVEGSGNTVPKPPESGLIGSLLGAAKEARDAPATSGAVAVAVGSPTRRGVAKRPRVHRVSSTRIGTHVVSQSSEGSVVDFRDALIDHYWPFNFPMPSQQQQQQQQQGQSSLREVLEDIKGKDRPADDDDEDVQCLVCCDRKKCVALHPCGHIVTCGECAIGLLKGYGSETLTCPVCKAEIKQVAFARL